jgi:drug/metabolite transporter (DMT)-like permease
MALELALLAVMVAWAVNFIVMKSALTRVPPVGYTLISFSLGGLVLLATVAVRHHQVLIPRSRVLKLALLGGLGFGLNQILFPTGLSQTTAANAALLIGTTPLLVMIVSAVNGAERFTRKRVAGGLVSLLGVALVVTAGDDVVLWARLAGDFLVLAAALTWASYISFGAQWLRGLSPPMATGWAMLVGASVILPLGSWQLATQWQEVWGEDLARIVYTGLVTGVGNALVLFGVQRLGATHVTQLQFLIPALVAGLAALFLAEAIVVEQAAGGILIVAGIVWARRGRVPGRLREGGGSDERS